MKLTRQLFLALLVPALLPVAIVLVAATSGDLRLVAAGAALGTVVAIALAAVIARRITAPVGRVVQAALEVARGKLGARAEFEARNEMGDLVHTFNFMSQALAASQTENEALYRSLETGYVETIVALANSIDSKDAYTRGHSQRVAEISRLVGAELGLSRRELELLLYGGILHDIGKLGIAEAILTKQARLTDDEMRVMRAHPSIGAEIVGHVSFLRPVIAAVRSHHERWDGAGYPDGLQGEQIPLVARIVNAADTWDACTTTRPYQAALTTDEALAVLRKLAGAQLDPKVAHALERVVQRGLVPRRDSPSSERAA